MWNIITTGNSLIKFIKSIKVNSGIVSFYKIKKNNYFILGLQPKTVDNLNNIYTAALTPSISSKYLFIYFIYSFMITWSRIIFKGKGFRIRNFQKDLKLTFNFGHSHWDRIKFYKFWFFWKIKRQNYMIVSYSDSFMSQFIHMFPTIKLINRYTKRGLRLKRQAIIRRFGKISQHVSSLH